VLPQGRFRPPERTQKDSSLQHAVLGRSAKHEIAALRQAGRRIVLGAGRIHIRKGVDVFLQVASLARPMLSKSAAFVWVGGGYRPEDDIDYSAYLSEQIKRSQLSDLAFFVGEAEDMDEIYEMTDVLLLCSRLDPLPNVGIEAMSAQIPVVAFQGASGISDLLATDERLRRLVVRYLDPFAAAQVVVELIENEQFRREAAEAIGSLARQNFDFGDYAARLDAIGRGRLI
jgi:glycosyltransferase involved in cell wall biosynthesis